MKGSGLRALIPSKIQWCSISVCWKRAGKGTYGGGLEAPNKSQIWKEMEWRITWKQRQYYRNEGLDELVDQAYWGHFGWKDKGTEITPRFSIAKQRLQPTEWGWSSPWSVMFGCSTDHPHKYGNRKCFMQWIKEIKWSRYNVILENDLEIKMWRTKARQRIAKLDGVNFKGMQVFIEKWNALEGTMGQKRAIPVLSFVEHTAWGNCQGDSIFEKEVKELRVFKKGCKDIGEFTYCRICCQGPHQGPREGFVGKVEVRGQEGRLSGTQQSGDEKWQEADGWVRRLPFEQWPGMKSWDGTMVSQLFIQLFWTQLVNWGSQGVFSLIFVGVWCGGNCCCFARIALQKVKYGSIWPSLCWTSLWFKTSHCGFTTLWLVCSTPSSREQDPWTFSIGLHPL